MKLANRYGLNMVVDYQKQGDLHAIVVHGLSGNRHQKHIQKFIEVLLAKNYSVISYDATNTIGESEGKQEDASITRHYEDLVDLVAHFKKSGLNKFILTGHSLGAISSLLYATNFPEQVLGVAAFSSPVAGTLQHEFIEKIKPGIGKYWKDTGFLEYESSSCPGTRKIVSWNYMEDYLKYDLRTLASKIVCPVLMAAGNKDTTVNYKDSLELSKLILDCEFHIIEGAPHTFLSEDDLTKIEDIFSDWLERRF